MVKSLEYIWSPFRTEYARPKILGCIGCVERKVEDDPRRVCLVYLAATGAWIQLLADGEDAGIKEYGRRQREKEKIMGN